MLSFCNGCGDGKGRCNGRGEQGKDALSVCAQGLCKDAKPTKHTQTLTLRKVGGIVRKISLMVQMGSNPHHSWLGLTEQQNLTLFRVEARVVRGKGLLSFCNGCEGDSIRCNGRGKQGKGVGAKQGIVRMLNKQSVYTASVVVLFEG